MGGGNGSVETSETVASEIERLRAQVDELLLMAVPFAVHHLLHGEDEWAEAFLDRVNAGEFGGRV